MNSTASPTSDSPTTAPDALRSAPNSGAGPQPTPAPTPMPTPGTAPAPKPPPRDAIIFVPGIGNRWSDQSLEAVSRQIAKSLDLADPETGAQYKTELQLADLGGRSTKICTISRLAGPSASPAPGAPSTPGAPSAPRTPPAPVVDVLVMDYRAALRNWFEQKAILMKCLLVFLAIVGAGWRLFRGKPAPANPDKDSEAGGKGNREAVGTGTLHGSATENAKSAKTENKQPGGKRRIKTVGQQAQFIYASFILLLLSSYLVLLLLAAYSTFVSLRKPSNQGAPAKAETAPATNTPAGMVMAGKTNAPAAGSDFVARLSSGIGPTSQVLFILATLLGVAAPDKWRALIEDAATDYVCMLYYMNFGTERSTVVGEFNQLVEAFHEWAGDRYRHVHVFAYSFGSVVAMDTLFPAGAGPARRVQCLDTFVTIGSPFDLLRLMWPGYFNDRTHVEGCPRHWLNLYSPNDIISSNFRNDDNKEQPEESVRCARGEKLPLPKNVLYREGPHARDLSLVEIMLLMGLRSHGMYWQEGSASERNCFTYIVQLMPELGH